MQQLPELPQPPQPAQLAGPARIVQVLVHNHGFSGVGHMTRDGCGIRAAAKRQQLHKEPAIRALRLPFFQPTLLADVRRFHPRAARGTTDQSGRAIGVVSRIAAATASPIKGISSRM